MRGYFLKLSIVSTAVLLIGFGSAQAATVNIAAEAGAAMETIHGIRDSTATLGRDLDGALITATYEDGTRESIAWNTWNWGARGGADGANTDLFMDSGSIDVTAHSRLTSLLIQLTPASSVFDISRASEGDVGNTPTSYIGYPFEVFSSVEALVGEISVTYSGIVNKAGRPADGDLYTDMLIDFSDLADRGFLGDMSFRTDMDTLRYAGDLAPATVPLPASLPFLLVGLAGLGLVRRVSS